MTFVCNKKLYFERFFFYFSQNWREFGGQSNEGQHLYKGGIGQDAWGSGGSMPSELHASGSIHSYPL